DDLPVDAVADRASCLAMGVNCLITIPMGTGGRITHVLCLTHRQAMTSWPEPILAWLRTIAETLLAVLRRNQAEQELQTSGRNLAEAQRIAGVGSYIRDWYDDTLMGSAEANRIFGVVLADAAHDVIDHVHADDRARVRQAMEASLAAREQ